MENPRITPPGMGESQRQSIKDEEGCVIRSLQSAMGAKASESEWDLRFAQLNALDAKYGNLKGLKGSPKTCFATIMQIYYEDLHNILNLVERIKENDSPLGSALRRHSTLFVPGDSEYISGCLKVNQKVLYARAFPALHVQHIALLPSTGHIYSVSDRSHRILTIPKGRNDVFVFTQNSRPN